MNGRFMRSIALSLTLAVAAMVCYAATTGVISGTVTDPSGAVVPHAAITVTNRATGVKLTSVSDAKGFYSFPALDVGTYTINASVTGFQSFQITGIVIDANSSVRTDIALKVGNVTQVTEVTANPVTIETQSTQLGQTIEGVQITAVPLESRAFTDLLALQPSVSPYGGTTEGSSTTNGTVSGNLNPGNVSVNGSREAANAFMVNGIDVDNGVQNGAAVIPNLDSLAEFHVITSNYDAEYGNFNGGQVNVITKSGTNSFHGTAFDYLRNTDLNAANYFSHNIRSPYSQNIYGGTVGGPIKRDKIFFYGDFQGTSASELVSQQEPQIPSAADLTGNLTDYASLISGTVESTSWANTLTTRLASTTGQTVAANEPYYTSNCNNTTAGSPTGCVFPGAVIPKAAWDPVPANYFQYIPQSSNSYFGGQYVAAASNGYPAADFASNPSALTDRKEAGRVDYTTHLGTFFAYYFLDNDSLINPFATSTPEYPVESTGRAQLYNVGLTSTLSSNKVNSARLGYMRNATHATKPVYPLPGATLSSLGFNTPWNTTGGIGNVNSTIVGAPPITINGMSIGQQGSETGTYDNTFQGLDNFTYVRGTHTFQVGVDYHFDEINDRHIEDANGVFSFSDGSPGGTGSGWADFLLGMVQTSDFTQSTVQLLDSRSYYLGAYGQDSWRATSSLTLNYGIRYEITTPWWDTTNKLETLIPGEQSVVFPGAPVGWVMPGDKGVPRTLAPIKHNKFAPRLGFAYAPTAAGDGFLGKLMGANQTSIRGSFGIFYTNFQDESGFVEIGDPPYGLFWQNSVPVTLNSPFYESSTGITEGAKFPFAFPPTNVSASNPDNNIPWSLLEPLSSDDAINPANTVPYTEEFTLGIQRAFGGNTVLTLNYVGSQGRHLANSTEFNPGNIQECLTLNSSANVQPGPNNPGGTPCGPGSESQEYYPTAGSSLGTSPIYGTRILNPTNGQGLAFGKNPYLSTSAISNYNSLQANLKHSSNWGEILVGYTYAKSMDDASGLTDSNYVYNPHADYGLSKFDVPQYMIASFNVHIPAANWVSNRAAKDVVGGWSITGITKLAAGTPVSITETNDKSLTGNAAGDLPNYTPGNLTRNHNPRLEHLNPTNTADYYFNTSLFSQETLGVYGNSHRRFFVGPGLNHTDLGLARNFHIHESQSFEFRAEAYNFANHVEFSNPGGTINSTSSFGKVTAAVQSQRTMDLMFKYVF